MRIEIIIYIYAAVCMSMIGFNGLTILLNRHRTRQLDKKDRYFEACIRSQIGRMKEDGRIDNRHMNQMERHLRRIGNLLAFEETMDRIMEEDADLGNQYLENIYPVFVRLLGYYRKRDVMYITYFIYVLRKYRIVWITQDRRMVSALLELLKLPSISCRENVLQVLYERGDGELVIRALKQVERSRVFLHPKMIHDGLLQFAGDKTAFLEMIWEHFNEFQPPMQTTLLNYMRFSDGSCCERVFQLLKQKDQDDEVCFACIRYFGKYYYEPAGKALRTYVKKEKERRWEYAAISSSALANYKCKKTIDVLCQAIDSANWHVRSNAAFSLQAMGLTYLELINTLDGNSRYAREIMQYWLDYREAKEAEQS